MIVADSMGSIILIISCVYMMVQSSVFHIAVIKVVQMGCVYGGKKYFGCNIIRPHHIYWSITGQSGKLLLSGQPFCSRGERARHLPARPLGGAVAPPLNGGATRGGCLEVQL